MFVFSLPVFCPGGGVYSAVGLDRKTGVFALAASLSVVAVWVLSLYGEAKLEEVDAMDEARVKATLACW